MEMSQKQTEYPVKNKVVHLHPTYIIGLSVNGVEIIQLKMKTISFKFFSGIFSYRIEASMNNCHSPPTHM